MNDKIEHYGIRSIRKRAEMIGSTVVYNSMQEKGTKVAVTVLYTV